MPLQPGTAVLVHSYRCPNCSRELLAWRTIDNDKKPTATTATRCGGCGSDVVIVPAT